MMVDLVKELITNQYQAALATVAYCIEHCPDENWNQPVANWPFYESVFHTLFYADYYLEPTADSISSQPFHQAHPELFGDYEQLQPVEPTIVYTRAQMRMYVEFCMEKAAHMMASETEESLSASAQFPRKDFSRAELHVYNIRHIQHHAAQLILRLRLHTDVNVPWFRSGRV